MRVSRFPLLLGALVVAGCIPKREAPPAPVPQPQAQPRPVTPPPQPPPPPVEWGNLPLTRGGWVYSSSGGTTQALFGPPNSEAAFIVRCDRARRQVSLWREGTASGNSMILRTTTGARSLPVSVQAEPLSYVWSALAANDRLLDDIAFSRGRFTVEVPGTAMLVIPSWPEPARVVEDCRS